jgi:membrane protease YdiL (CAAX protease family)
MRLPRRTALLRMTPFALFMALLALRAAAPADGSWGWDARWIYGVTVLVVGALLVPVMEELFWRSFLMRWIEQPVFEGVDP